MPDATITSTASTFGTISGVFSADQSTIVGTVTGIVAGTLDGSVGVPGPAGPAGVGLPAGGTSGQFLQKTSGVDYATDWVTVNLTGLATESWVTAGFYPLTGNPSGFLTASALTPYLTSATAASIYQTLAGMSDYLAKAGNLAGLANTGTARTNLGLGSLAVVNDAPSDGSQYARKNGAWDVVSAPASYITSVSSPLSVTTGNLSIDLSAYAQLSGATFTGNVFAPTPSPGTDSTRIATTEWVKDFDYAPTNSPHFTGNPQSVTPSTGDNDTSIATTAFVKAQGYITSSALTGYATESWVTTELSDYLTTATAASTYYPLTNPDNYLTSYNASFLFYPLSSNPAGYLTSAPVTSVAGRTGAITLANTDISGLGTMSTATAADYSTTTVANGLYYPLSSNPAGYLTSAPVTSVAGRTGAITLAVADVSGAAPLASPALTGTPTAPTATGGTNTTQIATTAFVAAAIPTNNVKAWVNFNGTGTVAIRASMNVSSITDNGAGDYTMNFTTALADANYAAAGFAGDAAFSIAVTTSSWGTYTQTTSAFRFKVSYGSTVIDTTNVHMTIHR